MRRIVTHPAEARAKGVAARKHLVRNFSPEVVARQLYEQVMHCILLYNEAADSTLLHATVERCSLKPRLCFAARKGQAIQHVCYCHAPDMSKLTAISSVPKRSVLQGPLSRSYLYCRASCLDQICNAGFLS